MTTAREIMTTRLIVAHAHESVKDVADRMHRQHVSGLPVTDLDGHIYGIVTEADIMRFLYPFPREGKGSAHTPNRGEAQNRGVIRWYLESSNYEDSSEAYAKLRSTPVSEVMTVAVLAGSPSDSVGHLVKLMQDKQVNRIPIVESDRLVGIVARSDIVRLAAGASKRKNHPVPEIGYR